MIKIASIFVLTLLLIPSQNECKTRFRMTRMICDTSNETVLQNISCRVQTYKRESFITIRATLLRKSMDAKVTFSNYRKYTEGYQRLIYLKNIEACKIIRNIENASLPFIQSFIDHIKSNAKGNFMSACNIIGEVYIVNLTFANLPAVNVYPEGDYIASYHFHDEFDDKIANITLMAHISKYK